MTDDTEPQLPIEVIIPAWGEPYTTNLPRALASVSNVAVRTVVGDSQAMVAAWANGANHVVEVKTKHPGPARAQGLAAASQPYVLFMDADDEMLPGALSELHEALRADSGAIGAFGYMQRTTHGMWPSERNARLVASPFGMYAMLFKNMMPANGSILLRRKSLLKIQGPLFTTMHAEDWHTALKIRTAGRVRFIRTPVYRYTVWPGSVSRKPRDARQVQVSHDALLHTAEEALGHPSLPLQLVERFFAKRYRDRA